MTSANLEIGSITNGTKRHFLINECSLEGDFKGFRKVHCRGRRGRRGRRGIQSAQWDTYIHNLFIAGDKKVCVKHVSFSYR